MIRQKPPRLSRLLRRFGREESGVALTEFAFSLPLLLTLILGGLETANLALAHLRVSQMTMTVADNAGRVDTVIDESNIYEIFSGADLIGASLDFANNGQIVLSSLQHNGESGGNEGQTINWQRCWGELGIGSYYAGEGDGEDDDSLEDGIGPDGNRIRSAEGTAVMFVETTYQYQPLIGANILGPREIRYESAFNVRERVNQDITNTQGLPVNECGDPSPSDGDDDGNNGHGNDDDGVDDSNPGGNGGNPDGNDGGGGNGHGNDDDGVDDSNPGGNGGNPDGNDGGNGNGNGGGGGNGGGNGSGNGGGNGGGNGNGGRGRGR